MRRIVWNVTSDWVCVLNFVSHPDPKSDLDPIHIGGGLRFPSALHIYLSCMCVCFLFQIFAFTFFLRVVLYLTINSGPLCQSMIWGNRS